MDLTLCRRKNIFPEMCFLFAFAETVAVPFQILLVGCRHMLCDCTVLPFAAIQPAVGCNPVVIIKNLNGFIRNPHINFAFYVFIRN